MFSYSLHDIPGLGPMCKFPTPVEEYPVHFVVRGEKQLFMLLPGDLDNELGGFPLEGVTHDDRNYNAFGSALQANFIAPHRIIAISFPKVLMS